MRILALLFAFSLVASTAFSQSLWKPIPKPATTGPRHFQSMATLSDTPVAGSNFVGFRFTGPTVLYAVNTTDISKSALFTCVGIDFENDYWDPGTNKNYTRYAIGAQFGAGGQFAPTSVSAVTAAALTFSTQKIGSVLLPFKLTLGALYNFTTKSAMAATGPGIPLNN